MLSNKNKEESTIRSRIQPWFAIVLVFMGIGLAAKLYQGAASSLIIPLVLVAIVFLLYKFPPTRWSKPQYRGHSAKTSRKSDSRAAPIASKPQKRRASPFKVIEGRKNKEDDPPRYH